MLKPVVQHAWSAFLRRAGVSLCALGSVLAGCASDPAPEPVRAAPAVRGAEQGLEVVWWPVDDSTGALARALAPYAPMPVPIDAALSRALRANGLRVVAVPAKDVETLRGAVRLSGSVQRRWLGLVPQWTPIVSGPSWDRDRTIELDQPERPVSVEPAPDAEQNGRESLPEGLLRLGPGRLRLLARCWEEPAFDTSEAEVPSEPPPEATPDSPSAPAGSRIRAVLKIEIIPQHEDSAPDSNAFAPAREKSEPKDQGLLFTRLAISLPCRGDEVYLLVPDTPGARWKSPDEVSNDSPGTIALPPTIRGVERPPTLGEAMLTDAEAGGFARTKIVVVLVPRVPDGYSLIRR